MQCSFEHTLQRAATSSHPYSLRVSLEVQCKVPIYSIWRAIQHSSTNERRPQLIFLQFVWRTWTVWWQFKRTGTFSFMKCYGRHLYKCTSTCVSIHTALLSPLNMVTCDCCMWTKSKSAVMSLVSTSWVTSGARAPLEGPLTLQRLFSSGRTLWLWPSCPKFLNLQAQESQKQFVRQKLDDFPLTNNKNVITVVKKKSQIWRNTVNASKEEAVQRLGSCGRICSVLCVHYSTWITKLKWRNWWNNSTVLVYMKTKC